jgi:hypothetical protein
MLLRSIGSGVLFFCAVGCKQLLLLNVMHFRESYERMTIWAINKPVKLFAIILSLTMSFAIGYSVRDIVADRDAERREIRLSGYQFINPLLECEPNQSSGEYRELRPFKKAVQRVVDARLSAKDARTIAVYFRDLENGPWFGINEKTTFTPSSLLKVPLMMTILKQAEQNASVLQKKIRYDGREDMSKQQFFKPKETLRPGAWYTVDDLIFRMIAYSDNNATRLLDADKGLERIRDFMAELGIPFDIRKTEECITVRNYSSFFRVGKMLILVEI